jgi:hypothetical protein
MALWNGNAYGAQIPEEEDRTATDSGGIYDTETQTNTTNGKGSEITYINVRSLVVINKCQILPVHIFILRVYVLSSTHTHASQHTLTKICTLELTSYCINLE